jgi:hypothetical protein
VQRCFDRLPVDDHSLAFLAFSCIFIISGYLRRF